MLLEKDQGVEFREAAKDEFSGRTHFAGLLQEFLVGVGDVGMFEGGFIDLGFFFCGVGGRGTSFEVSWFAIHGDFASDGGCGHDEVSLAIGSLVCMVILVGRKLKFGDTQPHPTGGTRVSGDIPKSQS